MKKLLALLLAVCVVMGCAYLTIVLMNNHIANSLLQNLKDCPLPPGTEILDSASIAGKELGCSNGMQYYGILLVNSDCDAGTLSEWYNNRIPTNGVSEWIDVFPQRSSNIFGVTGMEFRNYPDSVNCFQIRLMKENEGDTLLNLDFRGH